MAACSLVASATRWSSPRRTGCARRGAVAQRDRCYAVWHVDRGSEAEAAVAQLRPDVIVLDLILPDRNGLVLCANLKRRGNVPVIVCSATKRKDDAAISLHLGADDFLPKP